MRDERYGTREAIEFLIFHHARTMTRRPDNERTPARQLLMARSWRRLVGDSCVEVGPAPWWRLVNIRAASTQHECAEASLVSVSRRAMSSLEK